LTKPWDNDELRGEIKDLADGIRASRTPPTEVAGRAVLDAAGLSPRLRETGAALMTGASEKEIAHQLGISVHTTHQYVKILYRHFKVSSRAEYMARLQGDENHGSRK
jgi:DNA-binding NarL/FixJ family response regulator